MNAETTPGVCEGQSTCHMRARGYEAPLETRVRRGGFIENTLEMVGYLYVCSVVLRLLGGVNGW